MGCPKEGEAGPFHLPARRQLPVSLALCEQCYVSYESGAHAVHRGAAAVVPDDCGIEPMWNEYQQFLLSQQSFKE